jgi:hypothetical protein
MRRQIGRILGTVMASGLMLAALGAPVDARTTGKEAFKGVVVASGESGTRTVVRSLVIIGGVVDATGRIVEVQNRPGDADDVSRADLVFRRGRIHIVSTSGPASMSLNPQTCSIKSRVKQTVKIQGGTGMFQGVSGRLVGAVRARLVAARAADGSCSQEQAPLLEVDAVSARGHITI